ncbi:MAG: family 43 glycosylhydrolase [Bacteroidia bacterium]|nr:family 43 glycosylhydrolase [Bacteroidia bacterium]
MRYTIAILLSWLTINTFGQKREKTMPTELTYEQMVAHDPVMAYEDSVYYLYTTGYGVSCYSSKDLKQWHVEKPCMTALPQWLQETQPFAKMHLWAPDVIYYGGEWHIFYSSSAFGKNTSLIGHLTTKTLDPRKAEFGWQDKGKIIQSIPNRDNWNAIDPNIYLDENGKPWMVFGSFWGGIKTVKLSDDLSAIAQPEEWHTLSSRPRSFEIPSEEAGDGAVEAPFVTKYGEYYYLFVSIDYCCRGSESTYKVVVGRSKNAVGPYVDQEGKEMQYDGGTLVIEGDKKRYSAVGHCSVYNDMPCGPIFVTHAYEMESGTPKLLIKKIDWSAGWPKLMDM